MYFCERKVVVQLNDLGFESFEESVSMVALGAARTTLAPVLERG